MKEENHNFQSSILSNERNVWIQVPNTVTDQTGLLVILDAELYRDRVEAPSIIEELINKESIEAPLIVYVSHGGVEARWKECPCYPPFAEFISGELYPWIIDRYPFVKNEKNRVVMGLSYTGLAASYVALETTGLFTKVISQSGSYWSNECELSKNLESSDQNSGIVFFIDVGERETDINVQHKEDVFQAVSQIEGVERFRDALIKIGYDVTYKTFDGGHSPEGWASTLPGAIKWAFPIQSDLSTPR